MIQPPPSSPSPPEQASHSGPLGMREETSISQQRRLQEQQHHLSQPCRSQVEVSVPPLLPVSLFQAGQLQHQTLDLISLAAASRSTTPVSALDHSPTPSQVEVQQP